MSENKSYNLQSVCADLPGQAQFIAAMEEKVGKLLSSKLVGQFRMTVAPEGFHYGFKYGNNGYYNVNSLTDIDRTLQVDSSTGQLGFSQQPFTVLYEKILRNSSYHLSSADQEKMNKADIISQAYIEALISAFRSDFPSVPLPSDTSAVAAIFEYILDKFGSIDQIPVYYRNTKNAMADYSANAAESYQMHSTISNAQARLGKLIQNIDQPSSTNGGLQVNANSYYAGYSLPDFAQTFASLNTDANKVEIALNFSNFNQKTSQLSIDHQARIDILLPVFSFISAKSHTRYDLNTLVTSASDVDITMSFKGITALAPAPVAANATAGSGWYDESILGGIVRNTGKDSTGYCLINEEFKVDELFGAGRRFSRLKEIVIAQAPTITMTMTAVDTNAVSECFQHDSEIDVEFFGFAVSSSSHHYKTENVSIDTQARRATITLSAPRPSATVSVETEVAYVLGGVASYPPESALGPVAGLGASLEDNEEVKSLSFTFAMPKALMANGQEQTAVGKHRVTLSRGSHTQQYYLGEAVSPSDGKERVDAVMRIWYYYLPEEKTIWLSDADDFSADQASIVLMTEDGRQVSRLSSHSSTDMTIKKELDRLMEELILSAESEGLTVIRRREIPENMKEYYYCQKQGVYRKLGSTYFGLRNVAQNALFANAQNTSDDVFHDPAGTPSHESWIDIWRFCTMQQQNRCTNCSARVRLVGAHVIMGAAAAVAPVANQQVDILPLCDGCNNWHNVGPMHAAFNTISVVMIW